MKTFKAWIIIDEYTEQPLLTEAHPHIFWLRSVAKGWCENKWSGLSIKRVLIKEVGK